MYKKLIAALLATTVSSVAMASELEAEALGLVKQFGTTLKGQLVSAMKEGGPVKAIEFCNLRAPGIAADIAAASGWEVGRTSLKIRSEDNAPDSWELKVLQEFEAKKSTGTAPAMLEYSEVVEVDGKKNFRYMKAIPTEKACLNCHAATIAPDVEAKLHELYPSDNARGFNEGDIRGAFTLTKPL
ncbi:Tll0287-like domain-containing protein [Sedimenticola selenatireducens]|uniref:Tll0287-like domain-containing protein n=1 Tax=Sedimenticola selenatireducens TaxID=191960 RepID=UPI003F4AC2A7